MSQLPKTLPAFFWHFIKRQKWSFIILFASTIAHTFESNVIPYALKLMVDRVTSLGGNSKDASHDLVFPALLFLGMWVAMITIYRIQERVYDYTIPTFKADISMGMLKYVQNHSHEYFANNFAGNIAGKIWDMPRAAASLVELVRWRFLSTVWVMLLAVIWLAMVNIIFSVILAVWIVVHITISYAFARKVSVYSMENSENLNVLKGHIVDSLSNITTMRLFARRNHEYEYIGKSQEKARASDIKTLLTIWKSRIATDIPWMLMLAAMLALLVQGRAAGWVGPGDIVFVVFTIYNVMGLTWMFGAELPQFFAEIGTCRQALSIISKAHDITDKKDAKPLQVRRGEIKFDNVKFSYISGRNIFKDKTLTINAGEKVGLVGFSGSGKSTFVNLILRFYDVESGRILIDGQDIAEVTQESLRSQIAMIPQDATLFHRTLMENIRYGSDDATDEQVIEAAKKAHAHEFIETLPQGYDSLVGERGVKLSGGQRQRIAVARAILKNAPILILDEATSSLDSITEKYIQESLDKLMHGSTAIVIAHRLSTLYGMDRILVFKAGRIIEEGNHAALLSQKGHYAELWNMQAGGFLPDKENE